MYVDPDACIPTNDINAVNGSTAGEEGSRPCQVAVAASRDEIRLIWVGVPEECNVQLPRHLQRQVRHLGSYAGERTELLHRLGDVAIKVAT